MEELLKKNNEVEEYPESGVEDITEEIESIINEAIEEMEEAPVAESEVEDLQEAISDESIEQTVEAGESAPEVVEEEIKIAPVEKMESVANVEKTEKKKKEKPLRADEFGDVSDDEIEKSAGLLAFFTTVAWKRTWDKITTGLLIMIMATPLLILAYILIWFLMK